jgi:hypothetical protein
MHKHTHTCIHTIVRVYIYVFVYIRVDDLVVEALQTLKDFVDLKSLFSMLCNYRYLIICSKLELATVYYVVVGYIVNCRYSKGCLFSCVSLLIN